MKAISLHQPWASACIEIPPGRSAPLKTFETRSWRVKVPDGGLTLALHAAKKLMPRWLVEDFLEAIRIGRSNGFGSDDAGHVCNLLTRLDVEGHRRYYYGAVLGIVRVTEVFRTEELVNQIARTDLLLGDWSRGRYAWRLEVLERFIPPIPARGRQGLWNWEPPERVSHE